MRHSTVRFALLAAALAMFGASQASAQELFTPMYKAPYRAFTNYEIGAAFSQPTGSDLALEGFYGLGRGRNDVGVGIGYIKSGGGSDAISVGANFRTRVLQSSESFPLDGALTLGAGVLFGDGSTLFTVPVGLTIGRRVLLEGSSMSFVPYVMPTMIPRFGDNGNGDNSDIGFALGLGVNVRITPNLDVRVSGALGAKSTYQRGIGVGLSFIH